MCISASTTARKWGQNALDASSRTRYNHTSNYISVYAEELHSSNRMVLISNVCAAWLLVQCTIIELCSLL